MKFNYIQTIHELQTDVIAHCPVWFLIQASKQYFCHVSNNAFYFIQKSNQKLLPLSKPKYHSWDYITEECLYVIFSNMEDKLGRTLWGEMWQRAPWLLRGCCTGRKSPWAEWWRWAEGNWTAHDCVDRCRRWQPGPQVLLLLLSGILGMALACMPVAQGNEWTVGQHWPGRH